MKNRKKKIFLRYLCMGLCLILCLSGCAKTDKERAKETFSDSGEDILKTISDITEEEEPLLIGIFGTEIDEGILLNEKGLVTYYDIEEGVLVPLCTRPDCSHKPYSSENLQPDCPAALLFRDASSFGVYDGKLWYLKQVGPDRSILCQADVNGENVVERFEVPVVNAPLSNQVLWNNCLYLASSRMIFDDRDVYEGTEYCLLGIDLETGQEIEIEPVRNYSSLLYTVLGMREDWLYYYYVPEATNEYPDGKVIRWNCKTQEKEELEFLPGSIKACEWGGDYLVYSGERGETDFYSAVYDLATGENQEIAQTEVLVYGYAAFPSEIIYYVMEEGYRRYQIDGAEEETLGEIELSIPFGGLIYQTGDGYLLHCNMDGWAYVTRENFKQGGEATLLTDWEYPTIMIPPDLEEDP